MIDYAEFSFMMRNNNDDLRVSGRAASKGILGRFM